MKNVIEMFGQELLIVKDNGGSNNCEKCVFSNGFGDCRFGIEVKGRTKRPCEDAHGKTNRHFVKACE